MRKPTKKTLGKYKLVIDEWFVNGFNGKDAYLKLYPNVKDNTAAVNFSKVSEIEEVKQYIFEKQQKAMAVVDSTHKGILEELLRWITFDVTQTIAVSEEDLKSLPIQFKRLITKHKRTVNEFYDKNGTLLNKTVSVELAFVSKERAMEMINKHIGFYEKDNNQKAAQINMGELSANALKEIWDARAKD